MDTDSELAKAKWLLISGVLFVVSCFICYGELVYLLNGRETQASVTKVYEVTKRGRFGMNRGTRLEAEYAFKEPDGTRRTGTSTVGKDWDFSDSVAVRYTPGENGRSRLAGHVNWLGIILFFASVCALGFFGFRIWRSYTESDSPRTSRRMR